MGKKAAYENVLLRGRTVYISLPFAPNGKRRRVALSWLKVKSKPHDAGADTKLKQGRDVLARIEDRLVACAAPKWNLIEAIHDGRIPLQKVHATLAEPDGVKLLEALLSSHKSSALSTHAVAPLVAEWPATAIGKLERPTLATLKNRRARMSKLAEQLPTLAQWTTAALQSVISPDESIAGATNGKNGLNGATQRTYVRDASMFCKWLIHRGLLAKDPTTGVTVGKYQETQARCVDFPVLERIYEALPAGPIRDAFGLMMATGAEPQVVERVTADGVRENDQHVYLNGTKNQYRARWACVEKWYWPTLLRLKKDKRKGAWLIPVSRFQIADAVRAVTQQLRADAPDLEIPADFRPYDARHSWAARYVSAGVPLQVVATQLGHKDATMVIRLYGKYRANTSLLAEYESRALSSAGMLRPSAAALLSAEPSGEEPTERGDELAADSAQGTGSALIQTEG